MLACLQLNPERSALSQADETRPATSDEVAAAEQVLLTQLALLGRWRTWPGSRELTAEEMQAIAEDATAALTPRPHPADPGH